MYNSITECFYHLCRPMDLECKRHVGLSVVERTKHIGGELRT